MAECINRDSVRLGIEKHIETVFTYAEQSALYNIECMVEKIPAEDVRENVHGKWIEDGFLDRKTCSICGTWIADNTGTAKLNFCPNCGADNRGENNG